MRVRGFRAVQMGDAPRVPPRTGWTKRACGGVRQAEELARVQEEDAELLPMLTSAEQGSAPELNRFCKETSALGASERAEQVERWSPSPGAMG